MTDEHLKVIQSCIENGAHPAVGSVKELLIAYNRDRLRLALYEPTDPKFKVNQVVWVTDCPDHQGRRYTGAMTIRRIRYHDGKHQYSSFREEEAPARPWTPRRGAEYGAVRDTAIWLERSWRDEKYLSKLTTEQIGYEI